MTRARVHAAALTGAEGHMVEVDAVASGGLPAIIIVGLPDTALRDTRDRVRAAILSSGRDWPRQRITIGLAPATLPKRGSGFDLALAVALLAAAGDVPPAAADRMLFLAELGLDGRLRPVPGVLPAAAAAAAAGVTTVVVAAGNRAEAALVPGVRAVGAADLAQVTEWLSGGPEPVPAGTEPAQHAAAGEPDLADLAELAGLDDARWAMEICAAGGHHLSLTGPPGAGGRMLAERLPAILPDLAEPEALEVTSIHSVAGQMPDGGALITRPPLRAPHHTASMAAIVGGGSGIVRPGAASLAHRGVLLLDDAPEFSRDALDALRQPLETGEVVLRRAGTCARFPARFMLVLASGPCPCGKSAGAGRCGCSPAARARYLGRLSGPLLDRADIRVTLESRPGAAGPARRSRETSADVRNRVAAARALAAARLAGTPWRVNAEVPGAELRGALGPDDDGMRLLARAVELGQVSGRGASRAVRVAWTVADLCGKPRPGAGEVGTALVMAHGIAGGSPAITRQGTRAGRRREGPGHAGAGEAPQRRGNGR